MINEYCMNRSFAYISLLLVFVLVITLMAGDIEVVDFPDVPPRYNDSALKANVKYPPYLSRLMLEGEVKLIALISGDGSIMKTKIISSDFDLFNRPAVNAVKRTPFEPALKNGVPVSSWIELSVYVPAHTWNGEWSGPRRYFDYNEVKPGLKYFTAKEGFGGRVELGAKVFINYRAYSEDGRELDNSYKKYRPVSFKLGEREVPTGLEYAVEGMKLREKRLVIIPESLQDGGWKIDFSDIPFRGRLIMEIELVKSI